ncbi:MAG: HAMP domain-containing histidine kinase [Myxococcales bacterium]|nr:HAMP domain-containing histidine kinase [Myxococcales bacterium]
MSEIDFLLDLFELTEGSAPAVSTSSAAPKATSMEEASPETSANHLHARVVQTAKLAEIGLNFAAMIHELRQPMTGIYGFAQLLAEKPGDPHAAEWAEEIVQQSVRMQQKIEQLRRFSRIETFSDFDWIDPRAALDEALRLLPPTHARLRLTLDLPPELPLVHADHHALVQIFWNLLTNARDAMTSAGDPFDGVPHPCGDIRVETVRDSASGLVFRVLDQGRGIPDKVREQLFSPFVSSKGARGTGLGLYICRSLATALGATLTLATPHAPFITAFELRFTSIRER